MDIRPKLNLLDRLLLRLLARPAVRAAVMNIAQSAGVSQVTADQLKQATIAAVVDARRRGGLLAAAFK